MKSLDAKLANIHADPAGTRDFILADARDGDMAFGLEGPGVDPATGALRSLADYREHIREVVDQGLVDVVLMSASTSEILTVEERLFEGSAVTPAVRGNDTSDIHFLSGSAYQSQPSRPFATATVDQITVDAGADLALYSITPANDAELDVASLEAYKAFRLEAERKGLRHFLEVFDPIVPAGGRQPQFVGRFLADFIARTLAGVPKAGRPLFLKMPYHGAHAMEELASYDPHIVPGIMGGWAGTTFDAFYLLEDAKRHGARAALFGRKIKDAEHPLSFVARLRQIADGDIGGEEACRAYHADLEALDIAPRRALDEDLQLTQATLA